MFGKCETEADCDPIFEPHPTRRQMNSRRQRQEVVINDMFTKQFFKHGAASCVNNTRRIPFLLKFNEHEHVKRPNPFLFTRFRNCHVVTHLVCVLALFEVSTSPSRNLSHGNVSSRLIRCVLKLFLLPCPDANRTRIVRPLQQKPVTVS